jgi:hypothetical protein
MLSTVAAPARTFDFFRDTFAFRNELYWEYLVDDKTGRVTTRKVVPPPTYAHRCFVVVRSARQFFFHARFEPDAPPLSETAYAERIRTVVRRSDCAPSLDSDRLEIPGFASLREFSAAHAPLLKANCGGAWQSYFNRGHYRMIFPMSRAHQAREVERLQCEIASGRAPIIHVLRFPQLTINHALLVFAAQRTNDGIHFSTYDPNLPQEPSSLFYSAASRTFDLPRNIYWPGGRVDVYETYRPGLLS